MARLSRPLSLPLPVGVDLDATRGLPRADDDPGLSAELDKAVALALCGDPYEAEVALLSLVGSSNPVDAWVSRLELGTLLMDRSDYRLGLGLLS